MSEHVVKCRPQIGFASMTQDRVKPKAKPTVHPSTKSLLEEEAGLSSASGHSAAQARQGSDTVIDLAHLARMTMGEKHLEAEVLALFERQAGLLLARMQGAPPKAAAALAHTLAGSARGIGAWEVARAAQKVELAAQGGLLAEVAGLVDALGCVVRRAQAAIKELHVRD